MSKGRRWPRSTCPMVGTPWPVSKVEVGKRGSMGAVGQSSAMFRERHCKGPVSSLHIELHGSKAGHKDGHGQVVLSSTGMVALRGRFLPAIVGTAARRPGSARVTVGRGKDGVLGFGCSPSVRVSRCGLGTGARRGAATVLGASTNTLRQCFKATACYPSCGFSRRCSSCSRPW